MPKPEEFSPLGMYGKKDIFEKRLKEGYTEVALGGGDWVDNERIVRLWAFYHPDGRIATYEHPKKKNTSMQTSRGHPFEAEYNEREFQEHLQKFQIKLRARRSLLKLVGSWEE